MKKEYNFSYKNNKFLIVDRMSLKEVFSIDANKLEFDTLSYYKALFADVNEKIEIDIEYAVNQDSEINEKSAKYIYETIKSLTDEICKKLNDEYLRTNMDEKLK